MSVITLTTDFGTRDWFSGTMKGVIWRIQPRARIADITHEIPPGRISTGAFVLSAACPFFPPHTVHVAIVDPGVGSSRRAIAVETERFFFVGPDNGVLAKALARETIRQIRRLENPRYFLEPLSATFHGRDVFAPVAAHLCRGIALNRFGPPQDDYVRLESPSPIPRLGGMTGEVIYLDRFGNAVTNLPAIAQAALASGCLTLAGRASPLPLVSCYQMIPKGQAAGLCGSHGYMEIALFGGSAAQRLGLRIGSRVTLSLIPPRRIPRRSPKRGP
jgi:hypothetical protein